MSAGWSSHPRLAVSAVFALGLLLAYLVALPPHLVHHVFEHDDEHGQAQCPHLATSQQTADAQVDLPASFAVPHTAAALVAPAVSELPPVTARSAENPRAPPVA